MAKLKLKEELKTENRDKLVAFKLYQHELDKLNKFCKDNGVGKSKLIRYALEQVMEDK